MIVIENYPVDRAIHLSTTRAGFLVQMFYHWGIGDLWDLRPLNYDSSELAASLGEKKNIIIMPSIIWAPTGLQVTHPTFDELFNLCTICNLTWFPPFTIYDCHISIVLNKQRDNILKELS